MSVKSYKADVTIVGGGIAGIVSAIELLDQNKKVLILDRDDEGNLGGLAKWSFGGICMIGTPEQKRMKIDDSPHLALKDWTSFAEFEEGAHWPKKWAEFYTQNSLEFIYHWLKDRGVSFLAMVNWPERGLYKPGNSVPRWHITWGTGHGLMEALINHMNEHPNRDNLTIRYNHKVEDLETTDGKVNRMFWSDRNGSNKISGGVRRGDHCGRRHLRGSGSGAKALV
ncbi:FAD-dependent oxidoreductase [Rhodohalobacter sp.]|uniref:FAD-dependent oxidoreductase n=1 Tax=Rhodohalobacter sp. TaxID=1974210 RepID=UPI002ACD9388|nr:FAD-dependent oxidoreductase [Rhodohalobacter sp.]MDZ7756942.1 FAD-dependent oxidoreductase [Rhodohalobacter sp.]